MKRSPILLLLVVLTAYTISPRTLPVQAVSWGSTSPLPGADQYGNTLPKLLQSSNGSVWMVWEKTLSGYGQIYLMVNNGFGWSGEIPLINNNGTFDDVAPALTQLPNATIILAWSRGEGGAGACFPKTYSIYTQSYTNGRWSTPSILVQGSGSGDNLSPAMAGLSDGRVMMAWSKCNSTNGRGDLYYKIYNGTIWGTESLLVGSTTYEEKLPGITQTADGRVWVVYTANTALGNVNQLWDIVWNSSSWTSPSMFTNPTTDDDWPTIAQDRNQTLWVSWARDLANGTLNGQPSFQYDLFYKNSTNNGQTWSPEQTIAPNINSDDKQPFLIQAADKKLWMVYSSNRQLGNPFRTFNLYLITSDIVKIHDVAVTNVGLPAAPPYRRSGDIINFSVTLSNLGDYIESPKVNCYANNTIVYGKTVTVNPGQSTNIILPWNSTGSQPGFYVMKASIPPVPGEFNTSNNSLNASTIFPLSFRGDVFRHGRVDILDLALVGAHFGAVIGSPAYYPDADILHSGQINIADLALTGADFGKILPIHQLTILSVALPKILPRAGEKVTVTANITDLGTFAESTHLNLYLNSILTSSIAVNIQPGQTTMITFSWTATSPGTFNQHISFSPIANEFLNSNNVNSTLKVTFRGDVNRDGRVDIIDLSTVGAHFGSVLGGANYLAAADLDNSGVIDIADLALCGADFGKTL